MNRILFVVGVAVLAVATAVTPVYAGFLSDFVGNSTFSATETGFVNFAVYDNDGGNWITDLGLSSVDTNIEGFAGTNPAPTGKERNVFFFQVVRTDGTAQGDASIDLPFGSDPWTSMGFLTGTVFEYTSGATTYEVKADADAAESFAQSLPDGTTAVGFNTSGNTTVDPKTDDGGLDVGGGQAQVAFSSSLRGSVSSLDTSSVFFFTSHSQPLVVTLSTNSELGGGATGFAVPVSNPEPGSLVLLGLGMMGGGAGFLWKRRKTKSSPAV